MFKHIKEKIRDESITNDKQADPNKESEFPELKRIFNENKPLKNKQRIRLNWQRIMKQKDSGKFPQKISLWIRR